MRSWLGILGSKCISYTLDSLEKCPPHQHVYILNLLSLEIAMDGANWIKKSDTDIVGCVRCGFHFYFSSLYVISTITLRPK